jgi:signal transduction histidine kinase
MGLFTLYERLIVYLSPYVLFIAGIVIIRDSIHELFWVTLFVTLLVVVALIASNMNYSAYVSKFSKNKIIFEKSIELDNMYKSVEEALKKRTKELTEANELLINEINAKHEMEIEYIKARHLCEEKERILNEATEYEKLRTAFFANISHELRTPLTVIFSAEQMLALLLKDVKLDGRQSEARQYMHIIKQNCYRLIRLIANLIDITKIDAGYFQINFSNCDIVRIVEDITLSVAKYIECKNLSLIFDTEVEEKIISCDLDKIERIMLNLLSNAVKFTPEGGGIYVNMYEKEDRIVISVKDTGIGIPPEMQNTIFDRFVQVDKTTSRNNEGSGIGLSLVKSLVEMHGGNISLTSESGKGSEFIIELLDRTEECEAAIDKCTEIKGSDNIERINIEFSDIYFN